MMLGMAGGAQAQAVQEGSTPVVVELYTSQGCSSCPPADEFMADLAQDPNVIALSLHVDYWDYIGWKDTFGNAAFSKRQKAYAKAEGSRMIYTPQIIVEGSDRVQGNDVLAVADAIRRHMMAPDAVRLQAERMGDQVLIRAEADPPLNRMARVQLVRYQPEATVTIERGENAGRQITYHNIVTDWQVMAEWPGQAPFMMMADAPGSEPVVVIVQADGPAEVLAAIELE
jgi:hypothetical protein